MYNIRTQNDVLADNFYYFDGNKWNPILSENETTDVPLLAMVARLEHDIPIKTANTFIPLDFDKEVVKNSNLISYDQDTGLFTANQDGVYAITLQLGVVRYPTYEMRPLQNI